MRQCLSKSAPKMSRKSAMARSRSSVRLSLRITWNVSIMCNPAGTTDGSARETSTMPLMRRVSRHSMMPLCGMSDLSLTM